MQNKSIIGKYLILFFMVVAGSFIEPKPVIAQQVSPFQTGHYTPAFANVRDFTKMSPGLAIISYNYFGWGNKYADRDGNKHDRIYLRQIDPGLPDASVTVDINSYATVPAFFWGSNFTLLGGATYVAGISPSYFKSKSLLVLRETVANNDSAFTQSERASSSGFGDLSITPFGLSWGWKHFDATFYYGFTAPTGRYKTGADDNIGLGFWTHLFQGFGYWYIDESQASGLMLGLTYELNTKIKDDDLNPGDRFSVDWGFSQYLSERLELSIMGGHNWQIADDKGESVYWDASYHDRKNTLAFGLAYWAVKNRLYIAGKYMTDFNAKQRFLTQGVMVNLIFVTNVLDGVKNK